jgi:hypothetical protein
MRDRQTLKTDASAPAVSEKFHMPCVSRGRPRDRGQPLVYGEKPDTSGLCFGCRMRRSRLFRFKATSFRSCNRTRRSHPECELKARNLSNTMKALALCLMASTFVDRSGPLRVIFWPAECTIQPGRAASGGWVSAELDMWDESHFSGAVQ